MLEVCERRKANRHAQSQLLTREGDRVIPLKSSEML